jgi:hypothetical protein
MDVPVQLDDRPRARPLVQPIDVLGHEQEVAHEPLEARERPVAGIGLGTRNQAPTPLVPVPDEPRIAARRLGRRELLGAKARPEPGLCVTEGGDPALGGDAGAGERDDAARAPQSLHEA